MRCSALCRCSPEPATSASATAVVASVAARWDQSATRRLLDRHPRIVMNALTIVGQRLQELQNRYRELATERVEQRVARAVLRLGKVGRSDDAAVQISFPLSRQDIAEMTGTTLHTVSRILSAWEQRGVDDGGECGLSSAIRRHCSPSPTIYRTQTLLHEKILRRLSWRNDTGLRRLGIPAQWGRVPKRKWSPTPTR